jgi:hypothetical protein
LPDVACLLRRNPRRRTHAGRTRIVLDTLKARSATLFGHGAAAFEPVAIFDRPYSTVVRLRVISPESAPSYEFVKIYKVRPVLPYETPTGGVAVLDFATAQAGTRYHDIAHLFMHLELARGRARWRGIALGPVQHALLGAFDRFDVQSAPLFRLMLLQHIVCHVTQLADSAGGGLGVVLRTLVRWRWRACLTLPALADLI